LTSRTTRKGGGGYWKQKVLFEKEVVRMQKKKVRPMGDRGGLTQGGERRELCFSKAGTGKERNSIEAEKNVHGFLEQKNQDEGERVS